MHLIGENLSWTRCNNLASLWDKVRGLLFETQCRYADGSSMFDMQCNYVVHGGEIVGMLHWKYNVNVV